MFNKQLKGQIEWLKSEIKFLHDERWRMKHELWKAQADIKMICDHFHLSIEDVSERRLLDVRAEKNKPEQRIQRTPNPSTPTQSAAAS